MNIMSEMLFGGTQSILANWKSLCHNPNVTEQWRKRWSTDSPCSIQMRWYWNHCSQWRFRWCQFVEVSHSINSLQPKFLLIPSMKLFIFSIENLMNHLQSSKLNNVNPSLKSRVLVFIFLIGKFYYGLKVHEKNEESSPQS